MVLLRLADRQGVFQRPNQSRFQQWALAYLIVDERKELSDRMYDLQEFLWALLKPETYQKQMRNSELADGEAFMGPEEFEEIERFIAELDKPKKISAKEL